VKLCEPVAGLVVQPESVSITKPSASATERFRSDRLFFMFRGL
jgi:hypothetical protein